MASVNVYVPDPLKAQLDEIEGVNWSQIAQDAFKAALIQKRSSQMDKAAIAERLRATGGKNSARYKAGFTNGQEWAAQFAEQDELEMLAAVDADRLLNQDAQGDPIAAAHLVANSLGIDDPTDMHGDDLPKTISELTGFVEGARDVYASVLNQL